VLFLGKWQRILMEAIVIVLFPLVAVCSISYTGVVDAATAGGDERAALLRMAPRRRRIADGRA
jgi:hypothetical protein